jgi:hypothetical protein
VRPQTLSLTRFTLYIFPRTLFINAGAVLNFKLYVELTYKKKGQKERAWKNHSSNPSPSNVRTLLSFAYLQLPVTDVVDPFLFSPSPL